jgi:hypothetical protein
MHPRDQAIFEIHKFYSRMHSKKINTFAEYQEDSKIDLGELSAFCRDYQLIMPKTKLAYIFRKVQGGLNNSLQPEQFKEALPLLALAHTESKSIESQFKLAEIKEILEYPENGLKVTPSGV